METRRRGKWFMALRMLPIVEGMKSDGGKTRSDADNEQSKEMEDERGRMRREEPAKIE